MKANSYFNGRLTESAYKKKDSTAALNPIPISLPFLLSLFLSPI